MARRERREQKGKETRGKDAQNKEEAARRVQQAGEAGGFAEEAKQAKVHKIPARGRYTGRTIGDTATSYSSVGGAEEPEEYPVRIPEPDDNAPDYETPGGAQPSAPGASTGPVHDVSFRPAPGGYLETEGQKGRNVPFTGEVVSTRDSTFEEDPDTGKTAEEEEGEFVKESLEKRTRGFESG